MTATLVAKDLAAGHGDRALFSGLDLVVAPGRRRSAWSAPTARASRRCCAMLAGLRRARGRASCELSPPTATVGHLPQEPERRAGRDGPGLPGPAHRRRPRRSARWTRPPRPGRRERPGADDALRDAPGALARASAAPTSTSGPRRSADALGLGVGLDQPMTVALRRPGRPRRASPPCCSAATTSSCSTSPTNDLDLDGLERLETLRRAACAPAPSSSATTASSSPAPSTSVVELDLAQQQVNALRRRLRGLPGGARVARRHAREAYEEYADTQRRPRGPGAHAARLDGEGRPQRPAQGDRQRQDRPQVPQRGRPRSRPRRPGRPSG